MVRGIYVYIFGGLISGRGGYGGGTVVLWRKDEWGGSRQKAT